MKRILFNLTFAVSFIIIFLLILMVYFDDFAGALSSNDSLSEEYQLDITECQEWGDEVRGFNLEEGEGAEEVPVLMYHRIIDDQDIADVHYKDETSLYNTIVLKSEFEKQMKYLQQENYIILTSQEFQLFLENEIEVPKNSVLLTFDDGFKDNYAVAYPILKSYGYTALIFAVTSFLSEDQDRYDAEQLQYLSVTDVKDGCDVFEFYSHTYNFHQRTTDDQAFLVEKSKDDINKDISISLHNLKERSRVFAYPYGEYDIKTMEVLRDLQVDMAFTVEFKNAAPGMNRLELPRKEIKSNVTHKEFQNLLTEKNE